MKRPEDARRVLGELVKQNDSYAEASLRLAALDAMSGRRAEAHARVREVLTKYPKDVNAQLLNASFLALARKRDEALAAVKEAIAADSKSARAQLLAGEIYADGDFTEEAMHAYEQALKLDPRPLAASMALARLHLQAGTTDKALSYAQQALAIQPRNADVHNLLARIYLRRGEIEKAKVEVAGLQKAFPNAAAAFTLGALTQLAEKHPDAARASYERALQLDPGNLAAFEGLLGVDLAAGHTKEALARIDATVARVQPTADLLIIAAKGCASAGDLTRAEALLRRAIEADPTRLRGYALLAQVYVRQNRLNEATLQLQDVLKRNPKSVAASTMIGILLESQGRAGEAEKQYQQTVAMNPRAAVAANNLAYLYVSSNRDLDQALQLARVAKAEMPDEPHVSDTIGWIYVKKNMASAALPHLESSVKKTPEDPIAHYHLGMAYLETGEVDKAKASLKKALSLRADFDGASEARKALSVFGA
jgi:tetratricopeptide (TPR) repeat protein